MNQELKELFGTECVITEKEDYIKFLSIKPGIVVYEIIYKCKKTDDGWAVIKCSRGSDYEIQVFSEKEYAICALYMHYAKAYLSPETDHKFLRDLSKYTSYDEIDEACNLIETKCESKYFSRKTPKKDTICLDYENDLFTIYYLNKDNVKLKIVECKGFSRAICVLYNYSIILRDCKYFYDKLSRVNNTFINKYDELLRHYFNFYIK